MHKLRYCRIYTFEFENNVRVTEHEFCNSNDDKKRIFLMKDSNMSGDY